MNSEKFILTEDHLKLLDSMFVEWCDDEYGAPCIDPKRPYGNSDVESGIVEILGYPTITDRYGETTFSEDVAQSAERIHKEMQTALQICLCTQQFKAGTYIKLDKYDDTSWQELTDAVS